MANKLTLLANVRRFFQQFDDVLQNLIKTRADNGMFRAPAICSVGPFQHSYDQHGKTDSVLEALLSPILLAVPRNRRSIDRRRMRKYGLRDYEEHAKPKKNIVICLNCGQPHELHTICGNCYDKVRKETTAMRDAMGEDTFKYDHPREEVAYVYKGEKPDDFPQYRGRYFVQVPKERPTWFPKSLTNKPKGQT